MPGYVKTRFTDLNERESDEFTCRICLQILRDPVVTKCCFQAFCSQCMAEWLKLHKICPYDRQNMTPSSLSEPPRLLVNMINKLKIHCDYYMQGCEKIIDLVALEHHLNGCEFVPNSICKNCDIKVEKHIVHNCVQNLLKIKDITGERLYKMESENQELREKLTVKSKEISDLKIEKQNMRKLFESMRQDIYALKSANLAKEVESVALRDEFNILRSLFEDNTSLIDNGCDQNQSITQTNEVPLTISVKQSRRLSLPLFRSMANNSSNNNNNRINNSGVNLCSPKNSKANKASKNCGPNPMSKQARVKSSVNRVICESISEESVHEMARKECVSMNRRQQDMFELEAMFKEAIKKYD